MKRGFVIRLHDIVKAFCRVKHDCMEEWLMDNSPPEIAKFLMTMHRRGRAVARTRDGVASGRLRQGIRTGDTAGPRFLRGVYDNAIQKWSERKETPRKLIFKYGGKEFNMSYMAYADDLATIEVLEGDYVKEALKTDELLDECQNRCNLERHLGEQVCLHGGLGSRKRADEIEEKADGKLGVFTPIATYLGGLFVPSGSSTEEAKMRCARADEGAAGVAKFFKREALTTSGSSRCSKLWYNML